LSTRVRNGIIIAVIGIGIVVLGLFFLTRLVRQSFAPLPQPTAQAPLTEQVVVVTHDIPLGMVFSSDDLRLVEVPLELIPGNAVRNIETAIGRFSKVDMVTGEMVLNHHLADPTNVNHDVGFIIDDAQVLMAFPADDLMSSLSVPQRGDLVDLYVTLEQEVRIAPEGETDVTVPAGEEETQTEELTFDAMQGVEITALVVDVITEEQRQAPPVSLPDQGTPQPQPTPQPSQIRIRAYLLALLPQDALVLKHLKDKGAIFDIVLRAPTSNQLFDLTPVTADYLIDRYELEMPR
jgi:Flp pilus assembly protein CpaB